MIEVVAHFRLMETFMFYICLFRYKSVPSSTGVSRIWWSIPSANTLSITPSEGIRYLS